MRPAIATWIAVGLLVLGAAAAAAVGAWGPAIVLASGVIVQLLLMRPAVRALHLPLDGGARALAELVGALHLRGRAVMIPSAKGARLWIPPADTTDIPSLAGGQVVLREEPGKSGIVVTPPGQSLLEHDGVSYAREGTGVAAIQVQLDALLRRNRMARSVTVRSNGPRIQLEITHGQHLDACQWSLAAHPWNMQGACPVCSACWIVATEAMQRPVRCVEHALHERTSTLVLEVL